MRLKSVHLYNYKQHKDLHADFTGNLIAIIGANGKGKSNLVGAIQFALTGSQPGFKKEELTTWGCEDGRVCLEFDHGGMDWTLVRHTGAGKAVLTNSAGESWKTIRTVDQTLAERIGIDTAIAEQAVFVLQSQIDRVLFSLPRERELSFQKQVGVADAQKIHEAVTKFLNGLPPPKDYDKQIADLQLLIAERTQQIDAQQVIINDATFNRPDVNQLKTVAQQLGTAILARQQAESLTPLIATTTANITTYRAQIRPVADVTTLEAELPALQTKRQQLVSQLALCQGMLQSLATQQRLELTLVQAQAELAAVPDTETGLQQDILFCENSLRGLTAPPSANEVQLHQRLADALSTTTGGATCPLCESALTGASTHLLQMQRQKVVVLKQQQEAYVAETARLTARRNQLQQTLQVAMSLRATRKHAVDSAQRELAALPVITETESELQRKQTELTTEISGIDSNIGVWREAIRNAKQGEEENQQRLRSIAQLEQQLAQYQATYTEACAKQGQFAAASLAELIQAQQLVQKQLTDTEQRVMRENAARHVLSVYTSQKQAAEVQLAQAVTERSQEQGVAHARAVLDRVRLWFHYENGPHTVTTHVLSELTPNVNFFLQKLSAPFAVVTDQNNVGFRYWMTDGTEMPRELPTADSLSGAQRHMLALAFRLSAYCMFAQRLGILVLDEPTANMDEANVQRFSELLGRVQTIAADMNLQIIVISHHHEILPFCSSTIDLGR